MLYIYIIDSALPGSRRGLIYLPLGIIYQWVVSPKNQWLDHPNLGPIIPNGNGKPQNETQEVKSYYWIVDYYTNSGLLLYYSRIIDI